MNDASVPEGESFGTSVKEESEEDKEREQNGRETPRPVSARRLEPKRAMWFGAICHRPSHSRWVAAVVVVG